MNEFDLLSPSAGSENNYIYGVVVGIVKTNKLDSSGRIGVILPGFSGEEIVHPARIAVLMAGAKRGTFFLPEIDDEVLVAFECGDITRPYVIGALWNGKDLPPADNADNNNNLRFIKSRSGHLVRFDDTDGTEKIEIIDKSGKNSLTFDTANSTITLKSEKDLAIEAPNGKISLNAKKIEIKSSTATKVEAQSTMDLKANMNMTIKGQMVNIN